MSDRDRGARPSCLARESPSAGKISVFLEFSKVCETANFSLGFPRAAMRSRRRGFAVDGGGASRLAAPMTRDSASTVCWICRRRSWVGSREPPHPAGRLQDCTTRFDFSETNFVYHRGAKQSAISPPPRGSRCPPTRATSASRDRLVDSWIARYSQTLISMSFSVMAGLVPAIHVIQLARGPNAWPTGHQQ